MIEPTSLPNPPEPQALPTAESGPPPRSLLALALMASGFGGLLLCWGLAALVGALLALDNSARGLTALAVMTLLGVGALGLPLIGHAVRRWRGHWAPAWQTRRRWIIIGFALTVILLAAGQAALSFDFFPNLIVGAAQWLILVASAAALAAFTIGRWPGLSALRAWGYALSGAWLGTALSLIIEIIGFVGLSSMGALVLLAVAPQTFRDVQRLLRSFQFSQDLNVLTPWLTNPWVIALALLAAAGLIPLLEELLKALGVALTVRRGLTPATGFFGGVLAGLGFAVVESLLNLATPQESWLMVMVARTGTMIVHAFCTGLAGWGWGQLALTRRPWKLLLGYASAVAVHGVWNASAIAVSFAGLSLLPTLNLNTLGPQQIGPLAVMILSLMVLGGVALLALAGLGFMGYRLRRGSDA